MGNAVRTYRDLIAWQRAFELGLRIYGATALMPDHERFGLIAQLRRGAVSVASNIAEGYGRGSTTDYIRFLRHSRGSLYEIETQLLFARDLGFLSAQAHQHVQAALEETERVLAGLIRSLRPPPAA